MKLAFWILLSLQLVNGNGILLEASMSSEFQQLLTIFHYETAKLHQYVAVLEQKMLNVESTLQQKLNKSEEQVTQLSAELQVEKAKRVQLQKDSDDLVFKFFNLSLGYPAVLSKTRLLQDENTFMKNSLQNLTGLLNGVDFKSLISDHAQLLQIKEKQGHKIGFSASNPKNGSVAQTVTFQNVTTNAGNLYNSASGKLTCSVPGLYYFSLTIVKMDNADHAWCYIRKNGQQMVQAGLSGLVGGWVGATNSVILHLQQGDVVDVGGCSPANTMFSDTTFTGFLVELD